VRGIRARASRDAEFTEFVQAASPSLLRAALVLLDSREDAEDALQVTMLRTYRRWEQARQAPHAGDALVIGRPVAVFTVAAA
jgi:DNA-directed RNA polymerase specialized sigma24 family protein